MDKDLNERVKANPWGYTNEAPVKTVDGKPLKDTATYIDPDTLKVGQTSHRLTGYNAPETAKLQGGVFVPSQRANDRTGANVDSVAKIGGYTNLVPVGKKDKYGRQISNLKNEVGGNLGDMLTALGITETNIHSSDEALRRQGLMRAATALYPSQAKRDPLIALSQKEREARLTENKGNPLYVPRLMSADEAEHAAVNSSVGIAAVKRETEEIKRLEEALATGRMAAETRVKLTKELSEARGRLFMAATVPALSGGVVSRHSDRTLNNQAYSQLGTSWDRGVSDLWKGLGGIQTMAGEALKWDWLAERGQQGMLREKIAQADMPATLSSYKDLRFDDPWTGVTNTATYIGNLFAGTLPMLGMLAASTVGAAAVGATGVGAFALSAVPASLSYSGQFFADQPDDSKNPSLAVAGGIASAVLDRLGLEGIINPKMIFEKAAREQVLETMMRSGRYATLAEARATLLNATKRELVDLSEAGAAFAKQFYQGKVAKMRAIGQVGIGLGGEAATETLQTLVELASTSSNPSLDLRYERDFEEKLLNSLIGGGVMGGGIAAGGTAINMAQWHSAGNALAIARQELNHNQLFQQQKAEFARERDTLARDDLRGVQSVGELLRTMSPMLDALTPTLADLAPEGTLRGEFRKIALDGWRLIRQSASTAIPTILNEDGSPKWNLAHLKSIMAPGILPGDHYSGFVQRLLGSWQAISPEEMATTLGTNIKTINEKLQDAWFSTWAFGRELDTSTPENAVLQGWKNDIERAANQTAEWLQQSGTPAALPAASVASIFEDAAIDSELLRKNMERVVSVMTQNGSSEMDARHAVENVLGSNPALRDSGRNWMRAHGVFRDRELSNLLDTNVFNAFENFKHRAANKIAGNLYFGEDGKKLAFLLQKAWDAGEFGDDRRLFQDTAKEVSDWYKITQGTYGSLANYPLTEKILGIGVTMSMLASLGKATISSLPEFALAILGTPGPKVVEQLTNSANTFVREWRSDLNAFISWGTASVGLTYARKVAQPALHDTISKLEAELEAIHADADQANIGSRIEALNEKLRKLYSKSLGRSLHDLLGFNDSGYNSQAKFETTTGNMRYTMQVFAKAIGLRALSDGVRIAAASMTADIIRTKIAMLQAVRPENRMAMMAGQGLTNEQFYSLRELQNHGMDVMAVLSALDTTYNDINIGHDVFADGPLTPAQQVIRTNLLTTIGNMMDSRSANPQPHNLPKYYHDPRLRIVTAMTRFVATQTAVLLPRLYKDFVIKGDSGMRYQAFAVMAGALLLGALATALKDELSYEDGENPWLKGNGKELQRLLYSSGLIGRLDSAVDVVTPLYPRRDISPLNDPVRWTWDKATSIAPPIGWADKVVRAGYNIADDNVPKGVELGVRASPFIGSFPVAAKHISKQFKDENK
jgi:hypothetical protein